MSDIAWDALIGAGLFVMGVGIGQLSSAAWWWLKRRKDRD
jgi:hypothetical protein